MKVELFCGLKGSSQRQLAAFIATPAVVVIDATRQVIPLGGQVERTYRRTGQLDQTLVITSTDLRRPGNAPSGASR